MARSQPYTRGEEKILLEIVRAQSELNWNRIMDKFNSQVGDPERCRTELGLRSKWSSMVRSEKKRKRRKSRPSPLSSSSRNLPELSITSPHAESRTESHRNDAQMKQDSPHTTLEDQDSENAISAEGGWYRASLPVS